MKKLFLSFLILCLFAALITGCKKDKASDNTATAVTEETETTAVKVVQTPDVNGIMISGWYYSLGEDKDGNELMVADFEAKVGTPVKLYSDSNEELGVVTKKDAAVDGGGTRDFVKVFSEDFDQDFWVRDYAVVPFSTGGVVTEENIFLYTKPDLASIGTRVVEPFSIFAVFDEAPEGDKDGRFYKIRYYINDGKTYTVNGYLLKKNVETNVPYEMIQCGKRIEALKEEIAKDENSVDSYVMDELNEIYTYYADKYNGSASKGIN